MTERSRGPVEASAESPLVLAADSAGALDQQGLAGETPAAATETVALPVRACADCEQEQGLLDRRDPTKSHGHCRRHFLAVLLGIGCSAGEIQEALGQMSAEAFCPDLQECGVRSAESICQARLVPGATAAGSESSPPTTEPARLLGGVK